MEDFLTIRELIARWDGMVSYQTLANHRHQGKGPPFKKWLGKIVYLRADVERYEQERLYEGGNSP